MELKHCQRYLLLFLVWASLNICHSNATWYNNYGIYNVVAGNDSQLAILKNQDDPNDSVVFPFGFGGIHQNTTTVVAPQATSRFEQIMKWNQLEYNLVGTNLELQPGKRLIAYDWSRYYSLTYCYRWLQNITRSFPSLAGLHYIGKTEEGRDIVVVRINGWSPQAETRPIIFIEAGMYGNEWIAPATATYIINQLLTSEDEEVKAIAQSFQWYILPHSNPDGYEYSFNVDRLWRKNRRRNGDGCYGVDLNRNFDINWENIDSSGNPCSTDYPGPQAESEPETKAITEFISSLMLVDVFISLQGSSQKVLYPYGHSADTPPNESYLKGLLNVAINKLKERYGTNYTGGSLYKSLYPVSGNLMDWMYNVQSTEMAFTYKLRPEVSAEPKASRMVPSTQILQTAVETFDSLLALVKEINVQIDSLSVKILN